MTKTKDKVDVAEATSPEVAIYQHPKFQHCASTMLTFPKGVNVEYDSCEELLEGPACYMLSPRRPRVPKNYKNADDLAGGESCVPKNDKNADGLAGGDSPPAKKMKPDDDSSRCVFCDLSPCILDQGLYDLLCEGGILENDNIDNNAMNKQIRYDLYRKASNFIYGTLGKGVRKQLPHCVVAEIHDFAPEEKVANYAGFKEASTGGE